MPHYDYRCAGCGEQFEALQTIAEHERHEDHDRHEPLRCPRCGGTQVEQVLSSVFVITSKKS